MTEKNLTVKELYLILEELIEHQQGNSEVKIYNRDGVCTTLPKKIDPICGFDYVSFTDYR